MDNTTTVSHVPYEKMSDSTSSWDVTRNKAFRRKKGREQSPHDWIVTEKVHGSNLCFFITQNEMKVAKRTEFLNPNDEFFGYKTVFNKLKTNLRVLFDIMTKEKPQIDNISVYGELFGGGYPHPEVKSEEAELVQTGIYYSPSLNFYAFDIAISGSQQDRQYLNYDDAIRYFKAADLFFAQVLFRGTYEECLTYPIKFESTIPGRLGLPPLGIPNLAEGVVIKSVEPVEVSTNKGLRRAIVKKKIEQFEETLRLQESNKTKSIEQHSKRELLRDFVTPNRLQNVISKTGKPSASKQQKIILRQKLLEDVFESAVETIPTLTLAEVEKLMSDEAMKIIQQYFQKK